MHAGIRTEMAGFFEGLSKQSDVTTLNWAEGGTQVSSQLAVFLKSPESSPPSDHHHHHHHQQHHQHRHYRQFMFAACMWDGLCKKNRTVRPGSTHYTVSGVFVCECLLYGCWLHVCV